MLRAAHQLLDHPRILDDPIALRIVGMQSESRLRSDPGRFERRRSLRAFVVARSRYAEDQLERAVAGGVRQYVILGAGLDTFAYRNPHPGSLRVFEVDHPATQAWKRRRLEEAGIAMPDTVTFAPVDFERQTLADGLRRAGFDALEPAFFSLLGVAVYLTWPALEGTLRFVASLPTNSEIVFSYNIPSSALSDAQRAAREAAAKKVSAAGEPWITYFDPSTLQGDLDRIGYTETDDIGPQEANDRYFRDRTDGLRVSSGRLMRARV